MLDEILLIDDDEIDNETHKRVIEKAKIVEKITVFQYADEALEYLRSTPSNKINLIFLDINMPRMDGFEFMEEYMKLQNGQKAERVVIMLTTSVHPEDMSKAKSISAISEFMQKPLTLEAFNNIVKNQLGLAS